MINNIKNGTRKKYKTNLGQIADSTPTSRSSTGVKGVYKIWYRNKYQARIQVNGKEIILITTYDFDEACEVRKEAEEKYYQSIVDKAKENGDFHIK